MNIFPGYLFFLFRFARLAANTFISQGVPVYLFSDIIPTPFVVGLSIFCVLYLLYIYTNSVRYLALLKLRITTQTSSYFLSSSCSQSRTYLAMFGLQIHSKRREDVECQDSGMQFYLFLFSGRHLAGSISSFLDCCGV